MPTIITIASTKGGVCKTTLAANMAAILADLGQRTLAVDADIQPTLSSYFPLVHEAQRGLREVITTGNFQDAISRTEFGYDLILSNDPDGELQNWILHTPDGRVRLKRALNSLADYDVIVIDSQGAVSPIQDAAVLAGDMVLSPIPPEMLSAREFTRGTVHMLERLQPMAALGAPVGPLYGLLCRMDRTGDARLIAKTLRQQAAEARGLIRILETVVPATVVYKRSATDQSPVHLLETERHGPTLSARDTMLSLVRELLPHLEDETLRSDTKGALAEQGVR